MIWILFVIALGDTQYYVKPDSVHDSFESCMAQREVVVEQIGRPIIDYQAVCIAKKTK